MQDSINQSKNPPLTKETKEKVQESDLDKNISSTAIAGARVPMRIHDPNGFVVQWSEIQLIQGSCRWENHNSQSRSFKIESESNFKK